MKNQGLYYSLEAQLDKIARHNRQGSYRAKKAVLYGDETILSLLCGKISSAKEGKFHIRWASRKMHKLLPINRNGLWGETKGYLSNLG